MIELTNPVAVRTDYVPSGIYLTVKEYSVKHGMKESTVRTMISRGLIRSYLYMGQRLIPDDFKSVLKTSQKL